MDKRAGAAPSIGRDLLWSALRHWVSRLGALFLFLVLARILPASDFGLFSAAIAILAFTELFAEGGLSEAIVQAPELSAPVLSAILYLTTGMGILIAAAVVLAAPIVETFTQTPGLSAVLIAIAATVPFNAACTAQQAVLRRERKFSNLAQRALWATILAGAGGIAAAFAGLGAWSLVIQYLLASAVNFIFLWARDPLKLARPNFCAAMPLIAYGVQNFAARVIYYVNTRLVEIVLLYRYGAETLGYYIMGSRIAFVLAQLLVAVVVDVFLPLYARLASDRAALAKVFYKSLEQACFLLMPTFVGTAAIAPDLCAIAFGAKGASASRFLEIASFVVAFQCPWAILGNLASAIGRPSLTLGANAAFGLLSLLIMVPGWGLDPFQMVLFCCVSGALMLAPYAWLVSRAAELQWGKVMSAMLAYGVASAILFVAVRGVFQVVAPLIDPPLARAALLVAVGVLTYAAMIAIIRPGAYQMLRSLRKPV